VLRSLPAALAPALIPSGLRGGALTAAPFSRFTDVAAAAGLTQPFFYGDRDTATFILEVTGCGCAFIDYDNDGWIDIFMLCGRRLDGVPEGASNRLYHNNRDGTFTDVTEKAGLKSAGWAMGVCAGDYNNDGWEDLFVTYYGQNRLYRNNGDGTFTDVSKESGISESLAKAWGVVAADINNDGRMDLYVTNDTVPNFLFANRGKGKFEEIGLLAGVGVNVFGKPRSGMGVDAADYDQDGRIDLFEANVDHEMYSLYHNDGDEAFSDVANPTGIGGATRMMSGWGLKFFDYDNDGDLDLLLCNGHPDDAVDKRVEGVKFLEPLLLFHNTGKSFENVSQQSGPIFSKPLSGRGLALGDFDNDGSIDVLVTQNNAAPLLLRNNLGRQNHWLGVRLVGTKSNIDAIGAKITYQSGDLKRHQFKVGGGSYLSSHDPRMVLGLGKRTKIDWLEVQWPQPSGRTERFTQLPVDRYVTIVEGQGKWK